MPIVLKDLSTKKQANNVDDFLVAVKHGLTRIPKSLPSKYAYDDKGSELFRQIMNLPQYYLTRSEIEILELNKSRMLKHCQGEYNLVDLGAGDGSKTMIIVKEAVSLGHQFTYIPIDISQGSNLVLSKTIQQKFPNINALLLTGQYENCLGYLKEHSKQQSFVMFLGSSIGNISPSETDSFLMEVYEMLKKGDIMYITFDLHKDYDVIEMAYKDSQGISEQFEKNILVRINQQLGGEFDIEDFYFHSHFDVNDGCIKNYLVSKKDQDIKIDAIGKTVHFDEFQPMLMEVSHKFTIKQIEKLSKKIGFTQLDMFYDSKKNMAGALWCKQ